MKKVLITTLGCKVNQYESASFKASFENAGHTIVDKKEKADVVVINTCAVTANAGAQSRQVVRQAVRSNPGAKIIITGCFAEIGAEELAKEEILENLEFSIIGNSKKDSLVQTALAGNTELQQMILGSIDEANEICRLPVRRFGERSRAYLRIQDGCESFCTYCIVPYTRGPNRSLPSSEVIEQAKIFRAEGHKEIVLTGIHLGIYGKDQANNENFVSLLDKLSTVTPDIFYRISSIEPLEISEALLTLVASRSNIQPHLHIPLQSGDDEILARMNRRYSTAEFRAVIDKCRQFLPDAAFGIDIMAGFPGETDKHFDNTLNFLKSLDFTYLHVFPYSIRPGTVAAKFTDQISKKVKDERVTILRELSNRKKEQFYSNQIGKSYPVLVEGRRTKDGLLKGFTCNYVAVNFTGPDSLLNNIAHVSLLSLSGEHVLAEQITEL